VSSGKPNSSASPEPYRIDAPTRHSKPPRNKATNNRKPSRIDHEENRRDVTSSAGAIGGGGRANERRLSRFGLRPVKRDPLFFQRVRM
jgi:hypothetical protein